MDFILSEGLKLELEALIGSDEKAISLANLAPLQPWLRFDKVGLRYDFCSQPIFARCRLFEDFLNAIKPALKDSNKI